MITGPVRFMHVYNWCKQALLGTGERAAPRSSGQPLLGCRNVIRAKLMTARMPVNGDLGSRRREDLGKLGGLLGADNLIALGSRQQNRYVFQIWTDLRPEGNHRTEQHGARQQVRMRQQQAGGDIGAVGISDGNQFVALPLHTCAQRC